MRRLGIAAIVPAAAGFGLVRYEVARVPTGRWMAAQGLEPRYETIAGLRVRYVRAGPAAGPKLVLLHGIASSIYTWKDVLGELARDRDVVALDLPGFGGSDQPPALEADDYPKIVVGLMDRLAIQRASLVGHSLGGAVAVQVAAETPERVERLVLLDAAGFNLAPEQRPALLRIAAGPLGAAIGALPVKRALLSLGLRQVFPDKSRITPERVEEYLAPLQRPGAIQAFRSLLASRSRSPEAFAAVARQVRAPTVVAWGTEDRWIPVEQADLFVSAIPGARKVLIERCGHVPQEERPDETLRIVRGGID